MRCRLWILLLLTLVPSWAVAATTVRASSSATSATGTALSVAAPTGTTTGDVVIIVAHINNEEYIEDNNGATPFTQDLIEYQNDFTLHRLWVFSRRIVDGDPSTYNFTTVNSQRWTLVAVTLQNPHAMDIFDVAPSSSHCTTGDVSDGNGIAVPAITTQFTNALHFSVAGFDGGVTVNATPAGYTVLHSAGDEAIGVGYKAIASPSSTGTTAWADAEDAGEIGCSFSIKDIAAVGATVTLCASGCTYTATMANLNTAIAAARQGDTILIQTGVTLSGTIVAVQHTGGSGITVMTGVDASGNVLTPSANWPTEGHRLIPPSYADNTNESGLTTNYIGALAKIIPSASNEAAIRTQYPGETSTECTGSSSSTCAAHDYTFKWLDLSAPVSPNGTAGCVVSIGSNDVAGDVPNSNSQNLAAEEPYNFTFEQVYIHGTDTAGSKHGLCVYGRNVKIRRSWLSNHWYAGQDAQAIYVMNTTGGTSYETGFEADFNYVEGSGENALSGGDTPRMNFTSAAISLASSSTTGATLNAALPDYVREGDCVSVLISAVKQQACLATIDDTRLIVTFVDTLAGAPDVPGAMKGGVVMQYQTYTRNWFNTPLSWRGTSKGNTRKNLFEMKNAAHVKARYNYFSNVWEAGQDGTAIVFTVLNQDSGNDGSALVDILFEHNVVENMTGCFTVTGIDADNEWSQRSDGITIRNVACLNIDQATYGNGADGDFFPAINIGQGHIPYRAFPKNLTFDHVLIDSRASDKIFQFATDASTAPQLAAMLKATNFVFTNSLIRNPTTGPNLFFFTDEFTGGHASGATSWDLAVGNGLGTCSNNVLTRESSGSWTFCTTSVFPTTLAQYDAALVGGGAYTVDQGCGALTADCYDNASTTGTDIGPDWSILTPAMAAARSGNPNDAIVGGKPRGRIRIR